MLEDQVASVLQKYLGNYVRGLNKEALKISVWRGDVELVNMQLRPEALNALKLPVKVKAGFLGSVRIKVPWSRLGQEPVLVYLDRIFILAEPATQVEGSSEEALQEAKRSRVREMERKLLEAQQQRKSEMNSSWVGSLISTIIGNLKLSISNIHIRYEDTESNPGHPFAAGLTLAKLSAITVDDRGKETFATGVDLDRVQKSVELESLAFYFDSDSSPWEEKKWEDLLPSQWSQIFEIGKKEDGSSHEIPRKEHSYILQPVTGNAKYTKLRLDVAKNTGQGLQNASVDLDDVTLSLSKDGYRDILKLADNFSAFNQRLKYAHYRPSLPVKSDPKSWWKYAYKVVTDEVKKSSVRLSWDQVLTYARLRKRYVPLYASLLKSDTSRLIVDDDEELKTLDRQLDIEVILQWRILAHKFVEQTAQPDVSKQTTKRSWWPFGSGSSKDETEFKGFTEEDWERLNKIIGYKENTDEYLLSIQDKNLIQFSVDVRMKHNASKLVDGTQFLADLSCEEFLCNLKLYPETKIFDMKLGSYKLLSPYGLLAESATMKDSFIGFFCYKPFDKPLDWSFTAKASPCYVTYLKESVDQIVDFFKSSPTISQTLALETAAAVQMTIDEVRRTAQKQVTQVLKDQARFSLDLDIAAPKITIPTKFCPDGLHETKLLLDPGNLVLRTQEMWASDSSEEEEDIYLQFNLVLSDVSAFLVDGDYQWSEMETNKSKNKVILPVIDKCGIVVKFQQIQMENPLYPSTRVAVRLPSLKFHFSPARYHRLMQVAKIFQEADGGSDSRSTRDAGQLLYQANLEGWLSLLSRKGVGNREAVWQRRYLRLVGPFLYIFENPKSLTYKQWISLRGKQVHQVNSELAGGVQNILALYDSGQFNPKVLEDAHALILLCDSEEARRTWHRRLQGAIYRASGAAAISSISDEIPSPEGFPKGGSYNFEEGILPNDDVSMEKLFLAGVLDELKICFSSSCDSNQDFKKILLSEENNLFEFRAVGGQVELSMKAGNILIGTILRSLEIEDQYNYSAGPTSIPRYLARSFINTTDDTSPRSSSSIGLEKPQGGKSGNLLQKAESEERFFEASDDFDEVYETPFQHQRSSSEFSLKPPGFTRIAGLIPDIQTESSEEPALEKDDSSDTLGSFVKAQVVIYNQSSPQYNNLDNRVVLTLATLSFFCHRPTIVAIMEFANAINFVEEKGNNNNSTTPNITKEESTDVEEASSVVEGAPPIKGLLGKGKIRVIFHLTLNMAKAMIFLMNESGDSLATLSQNNLLTDIKVFPSSFSIKAALGNLKISDDSLNKTHPYFWVCDMRNPGGSSFVVIDFTSFSKDDDDYHGYDYSLSGELSEVRLVYLNRFIQEIVGYFMGLVPRNADSIVKLRDEVSDSEKWISKTDMEGMPALKLDLSLSRPIILMPRRTDSLDFLELDVLSITVENRFLWLGGDRNDMNAVHLELMTIKVKDINLRIGIDMVCGESIIQDVSGLSLEIHRSLRDLHHQIPSVEASIKMGVLKAVLSNREYEIITECALSNFSETPNIVPALDRTSPTTATAAATTVANDDTIVSSNDDVVVSSTPPPPHKNEETWITIKCSVAVNLVELSLHLGSSRDSPLATLQATGAWLLYKSNMRREGFLFATLKGFSVLDDREATKEEFRLAMGKSMTVRDTSSEDQSYENDSVVLPMSWEKRVKHELGFYPIPSMLILDASFKESSTKVALCIQRPKFLVVLDFLLAFIEFFVPSVGTILSNEEEREWSPQIVSAVVFQDWIYTQDSAVLSLSPNKPLIADDERFDLFVYDGNGGKLYLRDRNGEAFYGPSSESFIFVGSGKRLQFKNVTIVDGEYLDSCISLGSNSSYSASEEDGVYLERENRDSNLSSSLERTESVAIPQARTTASASAELVVELQAIGPELTFYSSSKNVGESFGLSTKVIHANTDAFCRLEMKGDSMEMSGNILGLKMESNGVRVLEPFDSSVKYSSASGKTNINLSCSEIYMNFSFSILRLFLAVEEDILAFLHMSSKKATELCSQFDNVATIQSQGNDATYAFWRPRAPSGFATLGDCLTPLNEPPSKGVLALSTSIVRVKRPVSYKLVWRERPTSMRDETSGCSVWLPVAPKGYVAMGCVVSAASAEPPLSSTFCILSSMVSPCALKDCIVLSDSDPVPNTALWRVDNSFGTFLLANQEDTSLIGKAYELRHMLFANNHDSFAESSKRSTAPRNSQRYNNPAQIERSALLPSGRLFEVVASFKLVWWNNGTSAQKKISIWRPVAPDGTVFFGDIAVKGYEAPNSALVFRDMGDGIFLKPPEDFQRVGRVKKQRGVEETSFWYPRAAPGFACLGCIASKTMPTIEDLPSLRCVRSDMVMGDHFPEESIWDTKDSRVPKDLGHFSLWSVDSDGLGTFFVRRGFKKPPRRLALKLVGPAASSWSDSMVIDAKIKAFSAVAFDDYGGLMMPLFGTSLENIGFSMHGRPDYLNANANFSLAVRSFNDKNDSWEPLIEPTDGFLRYLYDVNTPGAPTQLRMTSTQDLNLNISVSNTNMLFQAYSSWNSLTNVHESSKKKEIASQGQSERPILDVHRKRNYHIIPQNKLGQDIYLRTSGFRSSPSVIKLPSDNNRPVVVPIPKHLLDTYLKGNFVRVSRLMVTVIIADAELKVPERLSKGEYMTAVRLVLGRPSDVPLQQQSARTCAALADRSSPGLALVKWNEMFFFRVDHLDDFTLEIVVIDIGMGEPIGIFSASLMQTTYELPPPNSSGPHFELTWRELASTKLMENGSNPNSQAQGRIRCAVIRSGRPETRTEKKAYSSSGRAGFIQISPSSEGPWTTVKLNYAMPSACWRFGDDVVVSEMAVRGSDRYVNIRSLVSVTNQTDFVMELRLMGRYRESGSLDGDSVSAETNEFVEVQTYSPLTGWTDSKSPGPSTVELPAGWEWIDNWHVDTDSVGTADGPWVYPPNEKNKRQRRWIRHRKIIESDETNLILVGQLAPDSTIPLPLLGLTDPVLSYSLEMRPVNNNSSSEDYSWSLVKETYINGQSELSDGLYVSALSESDKLLFCSQSTSSSSFSSDDFSHGMWFSLSIEAKEIGKDVHSDPIQDWNIVIKSPLSLIYYLPFPAQYTVIGDDTGGQNRAHSHGTLSPGATVRIHNAGPQDPLYLSLIPQGGWESLHEPVMISPPDRGPSKFITLRNMLSQRITRITLEHSYDKDCVVSRVIRIYVPFWISCVRLPPLIFCVTDVSGRERNRFIPAFRTAKKSEKFHWKVTPDEMVDGYTIAPALNFKGLGVSACISRQGKECFGPVKELSPLGDMDGSIDLLVYDPDGNCMRVLVSSKPSSFQAVPTKVISARPFMTFTNMAGQDIFVRLNNGEHPKTLHASDWRVCFTYSESAGPNDKLQVRLEDTDWSRALEIVKEDTIIIVMRKQDGSRKFLKAEIRGYEEGSRYSIVFRLGPAEGPIRIENRTQNTSVFLRQSGLDEESWICVEPRTTAKYSLDDPYRKNILEAALRRGDETFNHCINLDEPGVSYTDMREKHGVQLSVLDTGDVKVVRFMDESRDTERELHEVSSSMQEFQAGTEPFELIIELGVVGVSLIDHRPVELLYLSLQRVFVSYFTGFDAGTVSRFKVRIGHLQLDNELPLSVMPVLLAPEEMPDLDRPVFKSNIAMRNVTADGTQVYPYIYLQVTENLWRLNVHEPIIWALVDFYRNLHTEILPSSSSVTQVDPEIRIELIDISEIRLKISLATAPAQRPRGVLGIWSPIFSAIGNAFKIQVHLRKVMHKNRYMHSSSVVPAITNRIKRDLIHNPLHLIFSVDVLSMTKSTLASLSKGFAELSTDKQFLQLRSKQVWSRRITGVGDGIVQGTEAFAQSVAFGVSGMVTKPVESAREHGLIGFAHGLGSAFLGCVVQPLSGALDFVSLTVDGIGTSFMRCLEILNNKSVAQRIRNPRAIRADGVVREYNRREAAGQMVLFLAEASRHIGCTDIFREPSKYAWSDYYEDHFFVPNQRIVLITNKRVMLLQCLDLDKMDKKPSKILWDVPWEEILSLELAKRGSVRPSVLIIHLKNFKKSEFPSRFIKCRAEEGEEEREPQAVRICCSVRRMWKAHQADKKLVCLKVPSRKRHVHFPWDETEGRESHSVTKPMMKPRRSPSPDDRRFIKHTLNFQKIWSSEQETRIRCTLFSKQVSDDVTICSIWRPVCPHGYISVGDIAHVGTHPPHVSSIYRNSDENFALPIGYDLVWRNCAEEYISPVTIWIPRPPDGYVAIGCVARASFEEPPIDTAYCVSERIVQETLFEEQLVWAPPEAYPWSCYLYQVQSEALQFVALREWKERSQWKPMRVLDVYPSQISEASVVSES